MAGAQSSPTPVEDITLTLGLMDLTVGESDFLRVLVDPIGATPPVLRWTSSNTNVATVAAVNATDARVTGVAPGTAVITVTTEDGDFTDTCTVTVTPASPTSTPQTGGASLMASLIAFGMVGTGFIAAKRYKR
jgi:uncharacterized protein YjdB